MGEVKRSKKPSHPVCGLCVPTGSWPPLETTAAAQAILWLPFRSFPSPSSKLPVRQCTKQLCDYLAAGLSVGLPTSLDRFVGFKFISKYNDVIIPNAKVRMTALV